MLCPRGVRSSSGDVPRDRAAAVGDLFDTRGMANGARARRRDLPGRTPTRSPRGRTGRRESTCHDCPVRRRGEDFARRADVTRGRKWPRKPRTPMSPGSVSLGLWPSEVVRHQGLEPRTR